MLLLPLLGGCASLGYYSHLAKGQYQLLSRREPIADIVADPARDAQLRGRLQQVIEARRFAVEALALPDNASYTLYADLGRPYVLWNVLATPEFSLEAVESCFPIAGCVAYRGYYDEARARSQIEQFRAQAYDTDMGGVPAYSTLGWFDDPVLNTMMHWSDAVLIGTVFHELAHQQLYVKGDTAFNESFARFVEQEGLRQYLGVHGQDEAAAQIEAQRRDQFVQLVLAARARLAVLYAQPLTIEAMRAAKQEEFARLKSDYAQMRDGAWQGDRRYERWFDRELNNASLLPFGLYDAAVPAFAVLFAQAGRNWSTFYGACRALAGLDNKARASRLEQLMAAGISAAPSGSPGSAESLSSPPPPASVPR